MNLRVPRWLYPLLALALGWLGYFLAQLSPFAAPLTVVPIVVPSSHEPLQAEVARLQRESAALQQLHQVDEASLQQSSAELRQMQRQIDQLQEELAFYRGVANSEGEGLEGLRVRAFRITANPDGSYRLHILLVRLPSDGAKVSGDLVVRLHGLTARGKTEKRIVNTTFDFNYFQTLQQDVQLADDVTPQQLEISLTPKQKRYPPITVEYEWTVERTE